MKVISLDEYRKNQILEPDPEYKHCIDTIVKNYHSSPITRQLQYHLLEAEFLQFMVKYATKEMPVKAARNYRYLIQQLIDITPSSDFKFKLEQSLAVLEEEIRKVQLAR